MTILPSLVANDNTIVVLAILHDTAPIIARQRGLKNFDLTQWLESA